MKLTCSLISLILSPFWRNFKENYWTVHNVCLLKIISKKKGLKFFFDLMMIRVALLIGLALKK